MPSDDSGDLVLTLRVENPRAGELLNAFIARTAIEHEGRAFTIVEALPVTQDGVHAWVFGLRPTAS